MNIIAPPLTTVEFLFAGLGTYDYDGNNSNMSLDADQLKKLRSDSAEFVKKLKNVARLVVVPKLETFSIYTRETGPYCKAKAGDTTALLLEDWPESLKHKARAQVASREEMSLELLNLYRYLDEIFDAVKLPEGVHPLVIFARDPSDDYQLIDQIRDVKGIRGAGNQMMVFYVCECDGREIAVRAMKNSQNKLKFTVKVAATLTQDTFCLTGHDLTQITKKGVDCSLKPLESFKQGFASNLNLREIQRLKQDLRASMATYAISYKDLYGSWPPGMKVSESDDGGVAVYLDGDAEDESNDEE